MSEQTEWRLKEGNASAAIVRLKRKRTDDPLPHLYLGAEVNRFGAKKQRVAGAENHGVFELAMTLVCEDFENWEKDSKVFADQLNRRLKRTEDDLSSNVETVGGDISGSSRRNNRFRLSRTKRGKSITVYDAVRTNGTESNKYKESSSERSNAAKSIARTIDELHLTPQTHTPSHIHSDKLDRNLPSDEGDYVYDIYQLNKDQGQFSVPLNPSLQYGTLYLDDNTDFLHDELSGSSDDDTDEFEEDSNEEGWVGNDYPEEEDSEENSFQSGIRSDSDDLSC